MARDPTPSESEALSRCGDLLRYAAENVKEIPKPIISTICTAWDAEKDKTWNQQVATEFWTAYNSLCALVKPVSIDALSTNLQTIPVPRWKFWRKTSQPPSLPRRTAARWVALLTLLLLVAVILAFFVATGARLTSEIEHLIASGDALIEKIVSETDALQPVLGEKEFSTAAADKQQEIATLQNQLQELNHLLDKTLQKTKVMSRLISFGLSQYEYDEGSLMALANISQVRDAISNYYVTRRDVEKYLLKASINVGVISSSVLPIILGFMGACAYVVRLISDQIKDTTFSSTSPIRHRVRVALGGLAGVVIGFGGIANAMSLSPSALAFIAGYAVEPVFATFDSIAEKFRR